MTQVCHLATAHALDDVRIYHKECLSLSEAGHEVSIIALPPRNAAFVPRHLDAVHQLPKFTSRKGRMTVGVAELRDRALGLNADVYHFHDPELIPLGLELRLRGKQVIYDVHESLPESILSKPYLPPVTRSVVATGARIAEAVMSWAATAIVAATPAIARRFPSQKTVIVQNFPLLKELSPVVERSFAKREVAVAYTGGITERRGALEMVRAMAMVNTDARLSLAGRTDGARTDKKMADTPGWSNVDYRGWCARGELSEVLSSVRAGLVLFHPEPNHVEAMPNKLFEYMSAGLPVIVSDFPLWRQIVEDAQSGLLVDPMDPAAIAEAIDWMVTHPDEAEAMGQRGRKAVEEKYNWSREAQKLIQLYRKVGAEKTVSSVAGVMAE